MNIQSMQYQQWSTLLVINKRYAQVDTAEFVDEALAVPVTIMKPVMSEGCY